MEELSKTALDYIREHGPVSSSTLPLEGQMKWHSSIHWSGSWEGNDTRIARSVLENLWLEPDIKRTTLIRNAVNKRLM